MFLISDIKIIWFYFALYKIALNIKLNCNKTNDFYIILTILILWCTFLKSFI